MSRHRQAAKAAPAPIPTAGAVDLEHLRGGNPVKQREIRRQLLTHQGFLCSCGARMEGETIVAWGTITGLFPRGEMTPTGPKLTFQDDAVLTVRRFHSTTCPHYLDVLKTGLPREEGEAPVPVEGIIRDRTIEWFDSTPEPQPEPEGPEAA